MENDDTPPENAARAVNRTVVEVPQDFSDLDGFLDGETPWRSRERSGLFPERPVGVEYGILLEDGDDETGGVVRCRDYPDLYQQVKQKARKVLAVWIPQSDYGVPLELLPSVQYHDRTSMKKAFFDALKSRGLIAVGLIGGGIYLQSFILIILALAFQVIPIFNLFLSWLTFPKDLSAREVRERGMDATLFQKWLDIRGANFRPLIGFLIVLVGVFLVQVYKSPEANWYGKFLNPAFEAAALSKRDVIAGDWWRLLTSGVIHGPIVHILFNGYALYLLGRILTSLSNIRVLTIVFLLSVVGGALASYYFKDLDSSPSVGASGGILGVLGYLCFICLRFRKTIPLQFTGMLVRNVIFISLIGVLGAGFIDNAAHAGGLITGVVAGAIIGPHRSDWWNAKPNVIHTALAIASAGVLAWTAWKAVVELW